MRVTFEIEALRPATLYALLAALVLIDMDYLRRNPDTPCIYVAGVRYKREGRTFFGKPREDFQDIPTTIKRGTGDCEDLSAWRIAQLKLRGEDARPKVTITQTPQGPLYHVLLQRGDGRMEDPSRKLGMV